MKELSLRPYNGRLFIAKSRKEYERQHVELFKTPDILNCSQAGRFTGMTIKTSAADFQLIEAMIDDQPVGYRG